jgi:hypothetical protein
VEEGEGSKWKRVKTVSARALREWVEESEESNWKKAKRVSGSEEEEFSDRLTKVCNDKHNKSLSSPNRPIIRRIRCTDYVARMWKMGNAYIWLRKLTELKIQQTKQTLWPESASELYLPSDRCLSAKLVRTFAERECHVVSVTDPYVRILGFLDRSRYFSFLVAPQLY